MSSSWADIVLILLQGAVAYIASKAHKQSRENAELIEYSHQVLKTQNAQTLEHLKTISNNQLYRN